MDHHFKHLIVLIMFTMCVAIGAAMLLLTHSTSLVSVAYGSGLLMGLFIGAYLYRFISKLLSK